MACGYPGIHTPSIEVAVVLKVMIGLGGLRCEVHSTEHVVAVTIFAAAMVGSMHGYADTAGDGYGYGCL